MNKDNIKAQIVVNKQKIEVLSINSKEYVFQLDMLIMMSQDFQLETG